MILSRPFAMVGVLAWICSAVNAGPAVGAEELDLAGEWRLECATNPAIACTAKVPGDVHSALFAAGLMKDPYYGANEPDVQWVGTSDWNFSREFTVDPATLGSKTVTLRLEDCDTFATVLVNGTEIGRTRDRFLRYDFNVKPSLKAGVNRIELKFESAENWGNEIAKLLGIWYPMSNVQWAKNQALVRKPACHGGWDWGPALMVTGPCGTVKLLAADAPRVDYVYTTQEFNADLTHCQLTVFAHRSDFSTVTNTLEIDNPPLWWPNGCGSRAFFEYEIDAHGVVAGAASPFKADPATLRRRRIGLRKLEVLNERTQSPEGKDELSLVFRVNNRRIFAKGANWIPCDAFDARQTPERYRNLLASAAAANMNMIRLWGGGQYEKDAFYDLCDELGLLVWHDMMCSCAVYPSDSWFLDLVRAELRHQLYRLRDHASIALWSGDNECLGATKWFTQNKALQAKFRDEWVRRSKAQGECVAKYDPTRTYWPSSPCCGPGDFGDGWKDDSKGDMHNWRVWHDNCPFDEYYRYRPRFCSEFGYQSFPSMEVAETFATHSQILAHAPEFEWHQKNKGGNRRIRETMLRYFRPAKDAESELLLSQFQHGMAMKMAVDGWRAQRPRCMGTLIWQLNDNWPVASWSMIEYGGKWKPLQHLARRFFAPVSVVAQPTVGKAGVDVTQGRITVLNDTASELTGEVTAEYWTYDGRIVRTDRFPVTVAPDSVADAGKFAKINGTFLVMNFGGIQNDWHFGFYKDMPLAKAAISVSTDSKRDAVTLAADRPAFFVWANVKGVRGEFDDNCFTLLPGRPKTIRFGAGPLTGSVTVSHLATLSR